MTERTHGAFLPELVVEGVMEANQTISKWRIPEHGAWSRGQESQWDESIPPQ